MEFLERETVLAIHDLQLARHGGLPGVRDDNMLESALARPRHLHHYSGGDVFALAASLAFGIARNHPFSDANKRTAWSACIAFMRLNQATIPKPAPDVVLTVVALAEGSLSEDDFAAWLRQSAAAAP
ncbi:type II toxin-antitoxin system death-on-curing family toxin [Flagellatimonas centrodinii]|uniref:type II toxin-antitoxin system death-on-curing family toxin n=1 Tax=Flagellatimonas centrodinii TaxID=2806210 RepID=UPI001FEF5A6B|nr:type II toxin-antitoxin system death-on-curing family toxin [Flagellatimonas centrodinii]ULQ48124.1 type II toxin-antitoxin system death-on-curing family toxin [Flagellatimonas centrodinii]